MDIKQAERLASEKGQSVTDWLRHSGHYMTPAQMKIEIINAIDRYLDTATTVSELHCMSEFVNDALRQASQENTGRLQFDMAKEVHYEAEGK